MTGGSPSLHRRPSRPLHDAHVALERPRFRWPLPHVAGSPDLGVLSASLTSARSSGRPRVGGSSGPYKRRLNLTDLPCSREALQLHADGTNPGSALPPLAITRCKMLPSPLGDGVGHSNHDRFRGYLSVHLRSGLQLPCLRFATAVTGRHARLGTRACWLGLAAVAISGACASRAFKAQPPQIRTCGFCRIRLLDRQLRYAPSGASVIKCW